MRVAKLSWVVFASVGALACSGSSAGGGGAGTGGTAGGGGGGEPTALAIDAATAIPTAGAAAAVVAFGAQLGATLSAVFEAAASAPPEAEAVALKVLIPFDLSDLCTTGTATGEWDDLDGDFAISDGDEVTLTLNACAGSPLASEAATGSVEAVIGGDGSISITIASTPETNITGSFAVAVDAPGLSQVDLTLGARRSEDVITVTRGTQRIEVSCFEISQTVFPLQGAIESFAPIGTVDVNGQFFTLNSYAMDAPEIDFTGSVPTSGSLRTASGVSPDAPCFDGTPAGDGSFVSATFAGGGNVTLDGRDAAGNAFSCMTTWDQLLDLEFITSGEVCGESMPPEACMEPTGATVVIADADFDDADWTLSVAQNPPAGGATVNTDPTGQQASGGLEGSAYRSMVHEITNPDIGEDPGCTAESCSYGIVVTHEYLQGSYTPATDGPLAYIDYSESHIITEPAFTNAAVGWTFAIFQDGTRYIPDPALREETAFRDTVWTTEYFCGLTAADFIPQGLNLTDGSEMTFAYLRSNSNTSPGALQRNVHGIDNFQVVLVKPSELCSGGDDEDGDQLVDCEDVFDCACTTECLDSYLSECQPDNLLANPGFEDDPNGSTWAEGSGFPTSTDVWGGDLADVVGSVGNIDPLEGTQMMQFQSTFNQPLPTASSSAERVQLVDVTELAGSRFCGVANFARISGDNETDTRFAVVTAWYDGAPSDFDGFASHITTECFADGRCGNGQVDIDAGSWVRAFSTTVLPQQEDLTAVVMVRAQENVYDDTDGEEGPELDGHFVDDVRLYVIPEGATCPAP